MICLWLIRLIVLAFLSIGFALLSGEMLALGFVCALVMEAAE